MVWEIGRRTRKMAYAQGVGRHTQGEVEQLLEDDLTALSDFLGKRNCVLTLFFRSSIHSDIFGYFSSICLKYAFRIWSGFFA